MKNIALFFVILFSLAPRLLLAIPNSTSAASSQRSSTVLPEQEPTKQITPAPLKGCWRWLENGELKVKCVVGGDLSHRCSSDAACLDEVLNPPRCGVGGCTKAGYGFTCDPKGGSLQCSGHRCGLTRDGWRCLPGGKSDLCYSMADCMKELRCESGPDGHGGTIAKCIPGGTGSWCSSDTQCVIGRCEWDDEFTNRYRCEVGTVCQPEDHCLLCSDVTDCPKGELRCMGDANHGKCGFSTSGAFCSSPGGDRACSELYCSSVEGSDGTRCVRAEKATTHIKCEKGVDGVDAREGDPCRLPDKHCVQNTTTGRFECKTGDGQGLCSDDADCLVKRCDGSSCFAGGFGKKCSDDTICQAKVCTRISDEISDRWACKIDPMGEGGVRCASDAGCTHTACDNGRCVIEKDPGFNQCMNDSDCAQRLNSYESFSEPPRYSLAPNKFDKVGREVLPKNQPVERDQVLKILEKRSNDPTFGEAAAPLDIVIFQDLSCGMCKAMFIRSFSGLKSEFIDTGKAKLSFVDFPLIHNESEMRVIRAALCANVQGRYIDFIDRVYSFDHKTRGELDPLEIADDLGLDTAAFSTCIDSDGTKAKLEENIELAAKLKIEGTPDAFINGINFGGFRELEEWRAGLVEVSKQAR